ncbi:MAG: hypothetical protein ABIJ74_01120 [archaeon]
MAGKETGTLLTEKQRLVLAGEKINGNPSKVKADIRKTFQKLPKITKSFFSDFKVINLHIPKTKEEIKQKEENYNVLSKIIEEAIEENPLIEINTSEIKQKIFLKRNKEFLEYQNYLEVQGTRLKLLHEEFSQPRMKKERKLLIKLYKTTQEKIANNIGVMLPIEDKVIKRITLNSLVKRHLAGIDDREKVDQCFLTPKGMSLAMTFRESL